jgi:hypothetical protein
MFRALAVLITFSFCYIPALQAAPAPAKLLSQGPQPEPSQDQPQYQQQDQQPAYQQQDQQPYQNQQQYQDPGQDPGYENFSPEQLDNLLSPIALYPDPLLAQVFVAATFPDQIEEAARFVRANGPNGVDDQYWDVSVRAVAHYPTVIEMMADKIDWTTSVGQAYVNQSTDVASSVQNLRHLAHNAGNLQSSQQQEVIEHDNYIAISPYQPEYIYVPVYDPAIIYYRRPYYGPAITFGVGFPIGAWLNLDFRWGYGGGWGGVYYTGWRQEGWGNGCWNCGWINRSRGRINYSNSVYINNRYNNIQVNRTVVNRSINVNNINRYNAVHRNVNYNNVQVNNTRANRGNYGTNGRAGNAPGNNGYNRQAGNAPANNGYNGQTGNAPGNTGYNNRGNNSPGGNGRGNGSVNRPLTSPGYSSLPNTSQPARNDRPAPANRIIDRNIDRNNPRIDQYRGRDTTNRNDRPSSGQPPPMPGPAQRLDNRPNSQQPQYRQPSPQSQGRTAPQSQMTRPEPHTMNPNETHFDPRASSQRGQSSRQQAPQSRGGGRSAPPSRPQERKKP